MNAKKEFKSQRDQSYRACIPFYILYDLDLNANHLRLYGQIEQMENSGNPNVHPTFSHQWMADQLKINNRNARKLAQLLVQKGYIEHIQIDETKWVYKIARNTIIIHDPGHTETAP